jgi:hypothetical protein
MPGADDFFVVVRFDSDPTANTLSARTVCVDPHDGHFTAASLARIVRCNCSNFASQDLHVYS